MCEERRSNAGGFAERAKDFLRITWLKSSLLPRLNNPNKSIQGSGRGYGHTFSRTVLTPTGDPHLPTPTLPPRALAQGPRHLPQQSHHGCASSGVCKSCFLWLLRISHSSLPMHHLRRALLQHCAVPALVSLGCLRKQRPLDG